MREHIDAEGSSLPTSMQQLQERIRTGRGKKKFLWGAVAGKLTEEFGQYFDAGKVARKWQTLIDGFKHAKDNNTSTGKAPMRYQFYTQMEELLGGRHDINFPVTATAAGVTVHRPEEVGTTSLRAPRKRKHDESQEALLVYLKESDARADAHRDTMITLMDDQRKSFEKMFLALLEKK